MVAPQSQCQTSILGMATDGVCNCLCDPRHQARVPQLANWGVVLCRDLLELVVSAKVDFPAKSRELIHETSVYKMDGPIVDTCFRLGTGAG